MRSIIYWFGLIKISNCIFVSKLSNMLTKETKEVMLMPSSQSCHLLSVLILLHGNKESTFTLFITFKYDHLLLLSHSNGTQSVLVGHWVVGVN